VLSPEGLKEGRSVPGCTTMLLRDGRSGGMHNLRWNVLPIRGPENRIHRMLPRKLGLPDSTRPSESRLGSSRKQTNAQVLPHALQGSGLSNVGLLLMDRNSSILKILAAPGALDTTYKGGGATSPSLLKGFQSPRGRPALKLTMPDLENYPDSALTCRAPIPDPCSRAPCPGSGSEQGAPSL
jgi:hypothetical protein